MQTVLPNTMPMRVFIITLPIITIVTMFLVFNLEDIVDFTQDTTRRLTIWMMEHMRQHRRSTWKRRAQALHEDRLATELPVKKRRKKTTRWMYFFYILEAILVTIPVDEVRSALGLWGLRVRFSKTPSAQGHFYARTNGSQRALLVKDKEKKKQETKVRKEQYSQQSKLARTILKALRIVAVSLCCTIRVGCLGFWIPLLLIELALLYLWTVLLYLYKGSPTDTLDSIPVEDQPPPFDWMLPVHLLNLHDVHIYPKPKRRQRSNLNWEKWYQSEKNPMNHSISGEADGEPKMLRKTRKRTTFFAPVTRTFTDVFRRRPGARRQTLGAAARSRGARANGLGGFKIDVDPGILEQGTNRTHHDGAMALGNLGSISEDGELRTSRT
jgi:hypothetical protein